MKNISKLFTAAVLFMAITSLTGCAEPGLVIKNGPAGPNTRDLLRPLPKGLIPDETNARHGNDDLKPNIN